jgi:putative SOS response-associated peptidase YedK
MLTQPSGPITSALHDRMPLVIPPSSEAEWIGSGKPVADLLDRFMKQPEPHFHFFPISPQINKSYENNPALLEFTPYDEPRQLSIF